MHFGLPVFMLLTDYKNSISWYNMNKWLIDKQCFISDKKIWSWQMTDYSKLYIYVVSVVQK